MGRKTNRAPSKERGANCNLSHDFVIIPLTADEGATGRDTNDSPARNDDASPSLSDDFVFVPITGGEAARGRGPVKKIIRAHVTRLRHVRSRKQNSLQKDYPLRFVNPRTPRDMGSQPRDAKERPSHPRSATNPSTSKADHGHGDMVLTLRLPSGAQQEDPFWSFPIEYDPTLPPIFAHYIQFMAGNIPELDGPTGQGLLRRSWVPLAMTEPATMYAVLLMAASHLHAVNPSKVHLVDILKLKAHALSEVNTAFADRSRALTDAMVGAVLKMAAYEAVFGDQAVYAAHMHGLGLMLRQRGGLRTLGLGGFLERMLVWVDFNAAHLTGSKRTLGGPDLPTVVSIESPDPLNFTGIVAD